MNAEKRELYRVLRDGLEAAELESNWHCEDYCSIFSYKKLERAAIALRTLESAEPSNG